MKLLPRAADSGAPRPSESIRAAATALQLDVTESQIRQLVAYVHLLVRWNKTYNLTAIRDMVQIVPQHIADCLGCVGPLRRELASQAKPRLLDVGSGGGLPGAVIAITCPEFDVTCIDTVGKKSAFVMQVAAELKLANLHGVHGRVESPAAAAEPFDVVCCRAFSSLANFVALTRHTLRPGGKWLAMKGMAPTAEISDVPRDVNVFHVEPLRIPGLDADRCLVWMSSGIKTVSARSS